MTWFQRFERFGSRGSAPMTNQDFEFGVIQDYEDPISGSFVKKIEQDPMASSYGISFDDLK
jgi:hypothetical protein